jgi:hypothetical protein
MGRNGRRVALKLILAGFFIPLILIPFTQGHLPRAGFLRSIPRMSVVLAEGTYSPPRRIDIIEALKYNDPFADLSDNAAPNVVPWPTGKWHGRVWFPFGYALALGALFALGGAIVLLREKGAIGRMRQAIWPASRPRVPEIYPSTDPYYAHVRVSQIGLYQHYFNVAIRNVDVWNYTKWSTSRERWDEDRMARDDQYVKEVLISEAEAEGLNAEYLIVMLHQFFFADVQWREVHQDDWARHVMEGKAIDDFPSGGSIKGLLLYMSGAFSAEVSQHSKDAKIVIDEQTQRYGRYWEDLNDQWKNFIRRGMCPRCSGPVRLDVDGTMRCRSCDSLFPGPSRLTPR